MAKHEVWMEFIGLGYEVTAMTKVTAATRQEAFDKAEEWYKSNGKTFPYIAIDIKDDRFINWD